MLLGEMVDVVAFVCAAAALSVALVLLGVGLLGRRQPGSPPRFDVGNLQPRDQPLPERRPIAPAQDQRAGNGVEEPESATTPIPHDLGERRLRFFSDRVETYPFYKFDAGHVVIDATVFPTVGLRQAPCCPVDGRPMRRAALKDLEALLNK